MSESRTANPGPERLELRLPVRASSIGIGRRAAAQFAEETGGEAQLLWRVRLAVSEALSNVVLHAHRPPDQPDDHHLELTACADAEVIEMVVVDHGSGMRVRDDSPGMGVGLTLIERTCDALEVRDGSDGGLVVRMRFSRHHPQA